MKTEERTAAIEAMHNLRRNFAFSILNSQFSLALLVIGCALASAPIWLGPGIINTHAGGDSPFLLIRTHELVVNLRAGIFPAHWMPNAAFGLGYPFFNYYASLPYYLAAFFNLLGINLTTAIKLTQTVGMFAAALAMYRFARDFFAPAGAALAAIAYTLAPFHLVNIYVRGDSLSEFYAFVWYPLILWAIHALTRAHAARRTPYATLTLSLAGLPLTHNVSALLFAPFIAAYALAVLFNTARQSSARGQIFIIHVCVLLSAAVLAMGLSAWFWLPALGETSLVQLEQQTTGYFNYANHFRNANLIQWSALFDYQVNPTLSVIALGLPHAILALAGLILWGIRRRQHRLWLAMVIGLLTSAVMLTPLSALIWRTLPLLALAQFPWRYLSVQAIFVAVLIGSLADYVEFRPHRSLPVAFPMLIVVTLGAGLAISTLWGLPNERLNVSSRDVNPHTVQLYEWQTGNIGTTIRAEYLPKTALPWPRIGPALLGQPPTAYLVSSAGQIALGSSAISATLVHQSPIQQEWQIAVQAEQVTFTLPLLAAPGWVDASLSPATTVQAYAGSGWVLLSRPRGTHRVVLRYAGTLLQHTGEQLSIVASVILLLLAVITTVQRIKHQARNSTKKPIFSQIRLGMYVGIAAVGLITFLIWASIRIYPSPSMNALDNNMRLFPHRGPLTLRTTDSNIFTLNNAFIYPQRIRAGESFTVGLSWAEATTPPTLTAKLELPPPSAYVVNQRVFRYHADPQISDAKQFTMTINPAALPGPTLLRLSLSDDQDSVFVVGPTVIDTPPNAPTQTVHVFGNGIALHQADLLNTSDQDICVRANWSRTPAMTNRADALQVSFRIMDAQGELIAQADGQPQAGLAPTWVWPLGAVVEDSYCGIPIAHHLREGEPFAVQVIWYRRQTLEEVDRVLLRGSWINAYQQAMGLTADR